MQSGKWTAIDSGIGAGVDSYFEYLVKGSVLLQIPDLLPMFRGKVLQKMCLLKQEFKRIGHCINWNSSLMKLMQNDLT